MLQWPVCFTPALEALPQSPCRLGGAGFGQNGECGCPVWISTKELGLLPVLFLSFAPGGYEEVCGTGNVQQMYFVLVILAVELCGDLQSMSLEKIYICFWNAHFMLQILVLRT